MEQQFEVFPPEAKPEKTTWRCVNNKLFCYCMSEPGNKGEPNEKGEYRNATCSLDPASCMSFRWLSEMVDISQLPEPNLVETFAAPDPEKKVSGKSKKAVKLEEEIAQQTF